jgi:hypothetical protein
LQRRVSGFIEIKAGSHKTPARRPQARKKSVPEENGKRREEEFCRNLEKKTEREEDNKFKPADSPHFQTAADNPILILICFQDECNYGKVGGWQDLFKLT